MKTADPLKRFIDLATLAVITCGLYFAYDQAEKLNGSITSNNKNINISTWANITTQTQEIDKIFVENPGYQKYFYRSVDISNADKDYDKAVALGTMLLDYFDSVLTYNNYLKNRLPETLIEPEAWFSYFDAVFRNSPLLCRMYSDNAASYGASIRVVALKACKASSQSEVKAPIPHP